jgi:FkbM family methyltransferase
MKTFYVFGDSHTLCFNNVCRKVYTYYAASAKGLSNPNSTSHTNQHICSELTNIPNESNILFFYGKVDMDFILNYKYNKNSDFNFHDYTIDVVNLYINFIKGCTKNKNVYVCELPVSHMEDENLLKRINDEPSMVNINNYLFKESKFDILNVEKVINREDRLRYLLLFNQELSRLCKENNFTFLEINKYFLNVDGNYEIPSKYINQESVLDHHLTHNVSELFVKNYNEKISIYGLENNESEFLQTTYIRNKYITYLKADNLPYAIGWTLMLGQYWEEWMLKYIQENYIKNTNIIDLGAYIGTSTLLMKEVLSEDCKIYSFEPVFNSILSKNIINNSLTDYVEIFPYGVSNKDDVLSIKPVDMLESANFGAVSLLQSFENNTIQFSDGLENDIKINLFPLDKYDFDNVSLIKINVGKMEIEVLEGSINLIKRCKPTIIFECVKINEVRESDIFKTLSDLGYTIHYIPEGFNDFIMKIN